MFSPNRRRVTLAFSASVFALCAVTACAENCRSSVQNQKFTTVTPPKAAKLGAATYVLADASSPNDCGLKKAQCGIWTCQGNSQNCQNQITECIYAHPPQPRSFCAEAGVCCNNASCTAHTCTDGGQPTRQTDAGDGGDQDICILPDAGIGCAFNDTELGNGVLGSAAQQVPGGVFCPGINGIIDTLTDINNCGYCGNKCAGGGCVTVTNGPTSPPDAACWRYPGGCGNVNPNGSQVVCGQVACLNGQCGLP
jgi:hypothetical protein